MSMGEFFVSALSGGVSFVIADGVDRLLATYNPASTGERPKDKFTSDGAGTLANTLNIGSRPGLIRVGAGVALAALPTAGVFMSRGNGYMKASMEGAAFGAWISAFKTLWNTTLMPLLVGKDTSPAALQKSYIARLYPAEVAATVNRKAEQSAVSSAGGAGALSGPQDVGPFALAADSPYPDAAQALRRDAGVTEEAYPSVQNTWGTSGPEAYPTAAQALRHAAGMSAPAGHGNAGQPGVSAWTPGPPSDVGPGPKAEPHTDPSCGCMADGEQYASFLGTPEDEAPPLVVK